jgi:hypothetical protein
MGRSGRRQGEGMLASCVRSLLVLVMQGLSICACMIYDLWPLLSYCTSVGGVALRARSLLSPADALPIYTHIYAVCPIQPEFSCSLLDFCISRTEFYCSMIFQ